MSVFNHFREVEMEYLEVAQGVRGKTVVGRKAISGIFKLRSGEAMNQNAEIRTSAATVHVHPDDFDDIDGLVGNGIAYGGQTYAITGATAGTNFDNGMLEHLRLTLEVASYVR